MHSNVPKYRLIHYQFSDFKANITVISRMVEQCVPGVPQLHPQFLEDKPTLFQPEGADYAHRIATGTPNFF